MDLLAFLSTAEEWVSTHKDSVSMFRTYWEQKIPLKFDEFPFDSRP